KDAIVIAKSEDERRDHYIHNIELDIQQRHDPEYPDPCDEHGSKRDERQLYSSKRNVQYHKHQDGSKRDDKIEIVMHELDEKIGDHPPVHDLCRRSLYNPPYFFSCCWQHIEK